MHAGGRGARRNAKQVERKNGAAEARFPVARGGSARKLLTGPLGRSGPQVQCRGVGNGLLVPIAVSNTGRSRGWGERGFPVADLWVRVVTTAAALSCCAGSLPQRRSHSFGGITCQKLHSYFFLNIMNNYPRHPKYRLISVSPAGRGALCRCSRRRG